MPTLEDHLDTGEPAVLSPAPPAEDLIPEVRWHTGVGASEISRSFCWRLPLLLG
jgi:hypothetical protein